MPSKTNMKSLTSLVFSVLASSGREFPLGFLLFSVEWGEGIRS